MNGAGQNGEKMGHRIILLLVVGLVAFSSAMKELNQIQQLGIDASHLIAQWSDKIVPSEPTHTVVKLEACESDNRLEQSVVSVDLPWLARAAEIEEPACRAAQTEFRKAPPSRSLGAQIARLKHIPRVTVDPFDVEVRILMDHDAEPDGQIATELPPNFFKAKPRKHSTFKINPRDRAWGLDLRFSRPLRISAFSALKTHLNREVVQIKKGRRETNLEIQTVPDHEVLLKTLNRSINLRIAS